MDRKLRRTSGGNLLDLRLQLSRLLPVRRGIERHLTLGRSLPSVPVERRFEDGAQRIVVGLWNGIVSMVVALSTSDGDAQQRTGDDLQRIRDDLVASFGRPVAAGRTVRGHAHKP